MSSDHTKTLFIVTMQVPSGGVVTYLPGHPVMSALGEKSPERQEEIGERIVEKVDAILGRMGTILDHALVADDATFHNAMTMLDAALDSVEEQVGAIRYVDGVPNRKPLARFPFISGYWA